jgi:hypothetical protein
MKTASPRPTTVDLRLNIQVAPEVAFDLFVSTLGAREVPSVDGITGDAVGSSTGDLVGDAVGRSLSVHPAT